MVERCRVTHNVWLQMAAELGIFGFIAFVYLVYRAFQACLKTSRLLGPVDGGLACRHASGNVTAIGDRTRPAVRGDTDTTFTPDERVIPETSTRAAMFAAMVGWFVCACSPRSPSTGRSITSRPGGGRSRSGDGPSQASRRSRSARSPARRASPHRGRSPVSIMADTRRILVDARTPVNYSMFAPVHRAMSADRRVRFSFMSSDEPSEAGRIFKDAGADAQSSAPRGPRSPASMPT